MPFVYIWNGTQLGHGAGATAGAADDAGNVVRETANVVADHTPGGDVPVGEARAVAIAVEVVPRLQRADGATGDLPDNKPPREHDALAASGH